MSHTKAHATWPPLNGIPSHQALQLELHRRMALLLSSMFLGVSLANVIWCVFVAGAPKFAVAPALLIVGSAVALIASIRTSRHKLIMDQLNLLGFCVFGYMAATQGGLHGGSLLWLLLPVIFAMFCGSFWLALTLAGLYFALAVAFYLRGPAPIEDAQLTSRALALADERILLDIVLSSIVALGFIHISVRWIGEVITSLAKAHEVGIEAMSAKSLFLARVSHEIRTPLNVILGAVELLQDDATPAEQRRQLLSAQAHGAKMLLALVNDILDVSKLEVGKLATVNGEVLLGRVVTQAVELFAVEAYNKGIDITASITQDVPRAAVGDEHRLRQIIANLVNNAVKFTDTGGVHIHVCTASDGASLAADERKTPARSLLIEVSDTGPGIPEDALPLLFKPYTQADKNVAGEHGGTGLGLNICSELARLMGGDVAVTSRYGHGTTFTLTLPLLPLPLPIELVRATAPACRPTRALVASAWPGMLRHMKSLLDDMGVTCITCTEMPSLDMVTRCQAQVVLIDSPLLASTIDAKKTLDELGPDGVSVALLAPLGSGVMVGAAAGTTILYKPVRLSGLRDFIDGAQEAQVAVDLQIDTEAAPTWLNVLVADDTPVNQLVVQAMLSNMHCTSVLVNNGIEALEAVARLHFDVVLMDIQMPEMDGVSAIREIRRLEAIDGKPRLMVIAMTGMNESDELANCLDAGMDRFLSKPFGLTQLRRMLEAPATPENAAASDFATLDKFAQGAP